MVGCYAPTNTLPEDPRHEGAKRKRQAWNISIDKHFDDVKAAGKPYFYIGDMNTCTSASFKSRDHIT